MFELSGLTNFLPRADDSLLEIFHLLTISTCEDNPVGGVWRGGVELQGYRSLSEAGNGRKRSEDVG